MNIERFEEELRRRVEAGKLLFFGKKTGTKYEILRRSSSKTKGWSVFADDRLLKGNTSFFSIASEIYDREVSKYGN